MTNPAQTSPSPKDAPSAGAGLEGPPARVVVVDDEEGIHDVLRRLFRGENWTVHCFHDAGAALEHLEEHAADTDIVVSDIRMPGMDGFEFLDEARRRWGDLPPFVFITTFAGLEYARRAIQEGAYDFVSKPLDFSDVIATVTRGVRHARLTRAARKDREQLEAERAARMDLTDLVVHRMTGPLSDAGLGLEILLADPGNTPQPVLESVTLAWRSIQGALDLARDLGHITRHDDGEGTLSLSDVSAEDVAAAVRRRFGSDGRAKHVTVTAEGNGSVTTDRVLAVRLAMDLTWMAGGEYGGDVTLDVRTDDDRMELSVDSPHAPRERDLLREEFCRKCVEALGGDLEGGDGSWRAAIPAVNGRNGS